MGVITLANGGQVYATSSVTLDEHVGDHELCTQRGRPVYARSNGAVTLPKSWEPERPHYGQLVPPDAKEVFDEEFEFWAAGGVGLWGTWRRRGSSCGASSRRSAWKPTRGRRLSSTVWGLEGRNMEAEDMTERLDQERFERTCARELAGEPDD